MEGLDAVENQSGIVSALRSGFRSIDFIYIAASAGDARYTRTCVASVRYFYPDVPIRLLISGDLERGLADELMRYWDVSTTDLPSHGDYGWGFVKLEPLFGPSGEKFLVLDSDTVLTGPILDAWYYARIPFLVDDERQSEGDTKRLYYDWEKLRTADPCARPPRFVFNSGQWFGTAGVLTRGDFEPWVEWTMPRKLRHPESFMPGDQGVLNYVFNRKVAGHGLKVERREIMRWPARSMKGLDAESVSRKVAPARIVHWAGLKKARQRDMVGADLLSFFENLYYQRLPAGRGRKFFAGCRYAFSHQLHEIEVRVKLGFRKYGVTRKTFGGTISAEK
jgi:hypothetical protein